jgi:C4-dicarboxylate transporter DctQ subunit
MSGGHRRFLDVFDHLEEGILAVLLTFMTGLTFIQVVLRYVFNSGWVWSLEATSYSFAWLVLIGMSYGVRTRTHIAVDLLVKKLPAGMKYYVALLAAGLCLLYSGMMVFGSWVFVDGLYSLGNLARDIPLPKWLLTAVMPAAFLLLAFRFLQAGIRVFTGEDAGLLFGERDLTPDIRGATTDIRERGP